MLADVALPIPVETTFTYLVPEEWQSEIEPGHRVVVSFGPRTLTGVVVSVRETEEDRLDAPNYKPIEDIPDDRPALTSELLELTRWVSDYYVCGWGEAIR
ncbi:MAG: primosomal protein N', partial [Rhodothermia bacterium]|nr:primosomal protein N' [Rhodothermia bacterium]